MKRHVAARGPSQGFAAGPASCDLHVMILPTRNKRAQAEAALAKGQPEKAAKLLEKWLQGEPSDLKVRRQLGDLYRQMGQTELAITHYTALAGAHAAAGLLLRAISTCKLILELDPGHTETQHVLATLYANKGGDGAPTSTPSLPPMMASALRPPTPPPEDDEFELDDDDILVAAGDGPVAPQNTLPVQPAEVLEVQTAPPAPAAEVVELDIADDGVEVAEEILDLGDASLGELDDAPPAGVGQAPAQPAAALLSDSMMELDGLDFGLGGDDADDDTSVEFDFSDLADAISLEEDGSAELTLDLPDSPLFSSLDEGAFEALLPRLDLQQVAAGEIIVAEGDAGTAFYVIVRGEVAISREVPEPHVLATLGEGEFFGEIAILADVPRSATVKATRSTELLKISREALDEVAKDHPAMTEVLEDFCKRRMLHNLVRSSPLLQELDETTRTEFIDAFRPLSVEPDKDIIREGETLKALFLVLAGEVAVIVGDDERARLKVGDVFGEMGLFLDEPAAATVRAVGGCQLLRLGGPAFTRFVEKHEGVRTHLERLSIARAAENASGDPLVNPHPSV